MTELTGLSDSSEGDLRIKDEELGEGTMMVITSIVLLSDARQDTSSRVKPHRCEHLGRDLARI